MRRLRWIFLLAFTASPMWTQDAPSTQNGPMGSPPQNTSQDDAPKPLSDGSYLQGPAITPPKIVQAVPAVYPADIQTDGRNGICRVEGVIGADGAPSIRSAACPSGDQAIAAAIAAVKASSFEPGRLNQQPIPVRVTLRVVFTADHSPATPVIVPRQSQPVDYYPRPIKTASAEYSEEARRKKIQGSVKISTLVNEAGIPTDLQVDESLGYGLDEKAMEAVSQYRFRPAMRDGRPIGMRISIEVNFKLF